MFSNQWVNHVIDAFSTNAVIPVVGWVEAIAESHHIHPPSIDGFRCALPILCGLGQIKSARIGGHESTMSGLNHDDHA
jgi:hypothetical protein